MKLKTILCLFVLQAFATRVALGQNNEHSAWGAWFHTQRFDKHWGASFDGQFRSANDLGYLKNMLLRPSVNYYFGGNKSAWLGYAYITSNGRVGDVKTFRPEHRIFEQFIITQKAGTNTNITHRFRLEQRFLGETNTQQSVFSQRLRYFIRGVIPISNSEHTFTQGPFLALQNEFFANLQNKNKINTHFFDQNRAYVAVGHRFSKALDVEAGYLNHYINQAKGYTINHVAQIALYTRFGNSK